jgi:hypothetical protein
MNGFALVADGYRKTGQEHEADLYDFLGSCSQDDFYKLFDSSAFNEIAMCYIRRAVRELVDEGTLDDEQARAVRNRVRFLFDEKQAKELNEE